MKKMDSVEKHLWNEHDNKVFKHIYFIRMMICDSFSYHEEYYLIRNSKVYHIQESKRGKDGFLYPTDDTVFETCGSGIPCGEFDENKKYPRTVKFFKIKDFKKQMKDFLTN